MIKTSVIIKYTDSDGNDIAELDSITGEYGDTYTLKPIEIEGYHLASDIMQSGSFGLNNHEIVFVNEKDSHSTTVRSINDKSDAIAAPELLTAFYGDTYHAAAKDAVGYAVHSVESETDGL